MEIQTDNMNIQHTSIFYDNISALYYSERFSDVVFIIEEKKIYAHKVILAARCCYFEKLLFNGMKETSQSEIIINDVSYEAFCMLLNYLYSGNLFVISSNLTLMSEVFDLANKYLLENLKFSLVDKFKMIINVDNVSSLIHFSELYDLKDLNDLCFQFLDKNSFSFLKSDSFTRLTQSSLLKLMERDTFPAQEVEIFKAVSNWCKDNCDVDNLVIKSIRLSQMSADEILSVVYPSQLIDYQALLDARDEIIGVREKTTRSRLYKLIVGKNVVSTEYQAEAICGNNTEFLTNCAIDETNFAWHDMGDGYGIVVKLGELYMINHIYLNLIKSTSNGYKYTVEVSTDQKDWKMVVDYRNYYCRSHQRLYFETEVVRYIRVTGHSSSRQTQTFCLLSLQAFYVEKIPEIVNGIERPMSNVVTRSKGVGCRIVVRPGCTNFFVVLGHPYLISKMKLWLDPYQQCRFHISSSVDEKIWTTVVKCIDRDYNGLQEIVIPEKIMLFIAIVGLSNYDFSNVQFECS